MTPSFNYEPGTRERHITLLGDSIFDNKIYVPGGLSVHEHLTDLIAMAARQ